MTSYTMTNERVGSDLLGIGAVGRRLRRARKAMQLTQVRLAAVAGLEQTTISKIETGDRSRGDDETLAALAKALNVGLGWLRDGVGEVPQQVSEAEVRNPLTERFEELDELLDAAFVAARHRPSDIAYLRNLLLQDGVDLVVHGSLLEFIEPARYWLDAISDIRQAGRNVTLLNVLVEATRELVRDLAIARGTSGDACSPSGASPDTRFPPRP